MISFFPLTSEGGFLVETICLITSYGAAANLLINNQRWQRRTGSLDWALNKLKRTSAARILTYSGLNLQATKFNLLYSQWVHSTGKIKCSMIRLHPLAQCNKSKRRYSSLAAQSNECAPTAHVLKLSVYGEFAPLYSCLTNTKGMAQVGKLWQWQHH